MFSLSINSIRDDIRKSIPSFPQHKIQSLYNRINVEKLKHHSNVLKSITTENIGKGLSRLSKEDISLINRVLNTSKIDRIKEFLIE